MDTRTVDPLFKVHRLNEQGMSRAQDIANAFDDLLTVVEGICEPGRELSIVKTKLEEAAFFAKKAMANQPENQLEPVAA